ncbi:protein DpdE [Geodermatophilus sp. FMUSA9-8]|uniref:protein DpdE n=1 Tax=Geodermatophilus sp. FMUSA9-8 TaxID=3120155 RepID=UPI0030083AAB
MEATMPAGPRVDVGMLVVHPAIPGVARVSATRDPEVQLELFDSAARPVAAQQWVDRADVRRCQVGVQTRVFWRDPTSGRWVAGRIVGGGPDEYFVRRPNAELDLRIPESEIRVRWIRPLEDPLAVLLSGGQESPYFRDSRLPALQELTAQRAACASVPALPSSRVQIHGHQIGVALKVLSDPVQRYLLADEVGLGKTIEAGFVIRQRFLEDPRAKVVVVAPEPLRRQWLEELLERFFVDDFPEAELVVSSHDSPEKWSQYHHFDLAVVDEAHLLAGTGEPTASPYVELRRLCHAVPRLLLLSATPVLQKETTHLGLLHLLDPQVYSWEQFDSFRQRLSVRRELATAVYSLDPLFSYLLPDAIDQVRQLLPEDPRFDTLAEDVVARLDENGDLRPDSTSEDLAAAVGALRGHVSETYRLHRRVLRNRRVSVLNARLDDAGVMAPFEVTGRRSPQPVLLRSREDQRGREVLEDWRVRARDHLLDTAGDLAPYAEALSVLASRVGGPLDDLRDVIAFRVRHDQAAGTRADLSAQEKRCLQEAPPLPFEADILQDLDTRRPSDGLPELVERLRPALTTRRAVVFAGRGQLASALRSILVEQGLPRVREHTRQAGAVAAEQAVREWREQGGLLICDASAEDGRNLQLADLVLHLRLPANPNELEQRIGRVDRYGSTRPAQQVVFGDAPDTGLTAAWREVLLNGHQVFTRSISALQDAVDRELQGLWLAALEDGATGLAAMTPAVARSLEDETKVLAQLDVLETSYESAGPARDIAHTLAEWELNRADDSPLLRLLEGDEGFRFQLRRRQRGDVTISSGSRSPLLGPQLLAELQTVPEKSRTGWTDRWDALRNGGRLFRIGNPLVDAVGRILQLDDRGRASAHWRVDPSWRLEPLPYFAFDYLVEGDLAPAIEVARRERAGDLLALRRRADRFFEPLHRRVWIPSNAAVAVDDQRLLAWLDAPYRNNASDVNLNAQRIASLHRLFGGVDGFEEAAHDAESNARIELERVTDLPARRGFAQAAVREELAVLSAQAEARRAAAAILADDHSAALDRALTRALLQGIDAPKVSLTAVTCLVRSGQRWPGA